MLSCNKSKVDSERLKLFMLVPRVACLKTALSGTKLGNELNQLHEILFAHRLTTSAVASEAIRKCSDILSLSQRNEPSEVKAALNSVQDILKELKGFADTDNVEVSKEEDIIYELRVVMERIKIDFTQFDVGEMPMTSRASASLLSKVVGSALLRPWMKVPNSKSDAIVKRMLQDDCLKANFKCMEHKCAFFTSDSNLFAQHIKAHFEDGQAEGHNQCSYCEFISKDSLSLIEHVSIDHWDNVQCNGCFFRCQMKEIARIHVLQCHHDTPRNSKIIEVTPSPYLSWASIKQMVSPLFCSDCNEKFYLVRGFKGHINTCAKNRVNIGRCVKCEADVCKKDTFDHLESCYEVGMFHCLYCRFGTNGIEKLQSHIMSSHPGELQFYCIRQSVELVVDPKCCNTMIIAMMKSSHEVKP